MAHRDIAIEVTERALILGEVWACTSESPDVNGFIEFHVYTCKICTSPKTFGLMKFAQNNVPSDGY